MKLFRSPWFYTILFFAVSAFTTILNGFYRKLDYLLLQPIPDSEIKDNDDFFYWVDWYLILFGAILPVVVVYLLSKYLIKKLT